MADPARCPKCGHELPVNAPAGLCPVCLLGLGMTSTALSLAHLGAPGMTARWNEEVPHQSVLEALRASLGEVPRVLLRDTKDEPEPPVVRPASPERPDDSGRYQFLGEIGHGGMGAVFKGRDPDLGRDLAIKVLLEKWQDNPDVGRRFVEEAQIGGQLQHPGIVPVYELGSFEDGRPYFTMRLLKGRTLAELLAEREAPPAGLPRFLSIFQAVCQTVAYAHARGVLHRDLKPSNIMVGSYGEVQVIDWGLAKVLSQGGAADESSDGGDDAALSVIRTVRTGPDAGGYQTGRLGTPAYMPPEQARGDVEAIDERADVFGLGSILCEVLTGKPVYTGPTGQAIQNAAIRGDTADALRRLDGCGADAELVGLARDCLMVDPHERPRDAGEVVRRLNAYVAGVQERLRAAELARAAEEARAEEARATAVEAEHARAAEAARAEEARAAARAAEGRARAERRARRMTVGLAAAVVALMAVGGTGATIYLRQRQAQSARLELVLHEVSLLRDQAKADPGGDPVKWRVALQTVKRAEDLLGPLIDAEPQRRVRELGAQVAATTRAAERAARLLREVVDIRSAEADDPDGSASDAAYARAFRDAEIDVDGLGPEAAGTAIKARPIGVALAVTAALDDWATRRRKARPKDTDAWKRLVATARLADPEPTRDRLRQLWSEPDLKAQRQPLLQLAREADPQGWPPASLRLLANALDGTGQREAAADLLRRAQAEHPGDVWVNYDLARLLEELHPPRTEEAIRFYSVARALRPETAHQLGHVLISRGRGDEAVVVFRNLTRLRPGNGRHWGCLGGLLQERGDRAGAKAALEKAVEALREAIRLKPDFVQAHYDLGAALGRQGKLAEAIAACREAIRLKPDFAGAHCNLGFALSRQGNLAEAIAEFREAIRLDPDHAEAHNNLGFYLREQGKLAEAIAAYREAIRLKPDDVNPHYSLGVILCDGTHDYTGAEAEFRTAIRLKPDSGEAHLSLGNALSHQGKLPEAIAEYREAIRLKPDLAGAHYNLGSALHKQGKLAEAIAECREAIQLKPDLAAAHYNLGLALSQQGELAEAIAAYREAIRLQPDYAEAHNNLGVTLGRQGKLAEAIAACREAIRLKPDLAAAHSNLGNALREQGKLAEAIAACREAIRLKPDLAEAHNSLGVILCDGTHDYTGAEAEFRTAIRLKPDSGEAHLSLGNALSRQGKLAEAIAEYREAIRHKPEYAEAHCNLGLVLSRQGQFREALAGLRRGHELGSRQAGWPYPSAQWVRQAERMVELESRLPAVIRGDDKPKDAAEGIDLADMAYKTKQFGPSARLYAEALAADPRLAEDMKAENRYNAACAAALAAAGQGEGRPPLTESEKVRWREQALDWLRADLAFWARQAETGKPEARALVARTLEHWKVDTDLAGIRDEMALKALPDDEQKSCRSLWTEVETMLGKAQGP